MCHLVCGVEIPAFRPGRKRRSPPSACHAYPVRCDRISLAAVRAAFKCRGRPIWVPGRLPRLDAASALATVNLPVHLNWSAPGRVFNMGLRADRARVYEVVLQEGRPADILAYVDGALLADLWDDLVLPRAVRAAWSPVIEASHPAAA